VWREITDPSNEENWTGIYARTFYHAQGNTGVVVVRDRVGQFRVHQAKNDPTALVQGQLRISRTIASALTDVLAASFGVAGISGLLPGSKADAAPESGEPSKPESDAENDETVRSSLRRREAAQRNLIQGLDRNKLQRMRP
jgi:hypothetical protein